VISYQTSRKCIIPLNIIVALQYMVQKHILISMIAPVTVAGILILAVLVVVADIISQPSIRIWQP
jgi:negative regulator of sigma E activity